jgi:hypothetical protein
MEKAHMVCLPGRMTGKIVGNFSACSFVSLLSGLKAMYAPFWLQPTTSPWPLMPSASVNVPCGDSQSKSLPLTMKPRTSPKLTAQGDPARVGDAVEPRGARRTSRVLHVDLVKRAVLPGESVVIHRAYYF